MSMADPFLPVPPENAADAAARAQIDELESDRQPDVLTGSGEHAAEEVAAAAHADQPERFRTPHAGDRLTEDELEGDLG
jgi:hypothetical protein